MSFDILSLKPSATTLEIVNPATGKPVGICLDIVSVHDERLDKIKNEISTARMKLAQRGKSFTGSELTENQMKINMAAVTGWRFYNPTGDEGDPNYDSEQHASLGDDIKPDFNPKNLKTLLTNPVVSAQVTEAISEDANFFAN